MTSLIAQHYTRLGTLAIIEVLPVLQRHLNTRGKVREVIPPASVPVKVTGVRLQTFATYGCTCSACGLEAMYFAIESNSDSKNGWHLNLWGIKDGVEVLFTHDHTIDRADGGADNLSNTTTMCSPCNYEKSLVTKAARDKKEST